jgi:hypothetical protein
MSRPPAVTYRRYAQTPYSPLFPLNPIPPAKPKGASETFQAGSTEGRLGNDLFASERGSFAAPEKSIRALARCGPLVLYCGDDTFCRLLAS